EDVEIRYVVPTSNERAPPPFCQLRTDYLDGLPGREGRGQHPPPDAAAQHVEDRVVDHPIGVQARTPPPPGRGQDGRDQAPGRVVDVAGVAHRVGWGVPWGRRCSHAWAP